MIKTRMKIRNHPVLLDFSLFVLILAFIVVEHSIDPLVNNRICKGGPSWHIHVKIVVR